MPLPTQHTTRHFVVRLKKGEQWVTIRGHHVLIRNGKPVNPPKWMKEGAHKKVKEAKTGDKGHLYHTTSHANMENISEHGLKPRGGGGTFQHGGYSAHSQGKTFLSAHPEAAREWHGKVHDQLENASDDLHKRVPVMLRVKHRKTERDEVGDDDVEGSRYTKKDINPEHVEFWHPKDGWTGVDKWGGAGTEAEAGIKSTEKDDGEDLHYLYEESDRGGFKPHKDDDWTKTAAKPKAAKPVPTPVRALPKKRHEVSKATRSFYDQQQSGGPQFKMLKRYPIREEHGGGVATYMAGRFMLPKEGGGKEAVPVDKIMDRLHGHSKHGETPHSYWKDHLAPMKKGHTDRRRCPACHARGHNARPSGAAHACPHCLGSGRVSPETAGQLGESVNVGPAPRKNRRKYPFVGKIYYQGLPVHIEQRKGDIRKGTDRDGHQWRTTMHAHYGEINGLGATGTDGDLLDVYVGEDPKATTAYIIDQNHPDTGLFDEQKVMLGFPSAVSAKALYMRQYDRPGFFGGMNAVPMERFKAMVRDRALRGTRLTKGRVVLQLAKGKKRISAPVSFLTNKDTKKPFPVSRKSSKAKAALNSPRHREIVEKIHRETKDPTKKAGHAKYLEALGGKPKDVGHLVKSSRGKRFIEAPAGTHKRGDILHVDGKAHRVTGYGREYGTAPDLANLPGGHSEVYRTSRHKGGGFKVGDVVRNPDAGFGAGSGFSVVRHASSKYIAEDGMSLGLPPGMDRGYSHRAIVRPATASEARPMVEHRNALREKKDASNRMRAIARDIGRTGEKPDGMQLPEGDRVNIGEGQTIYGGGEWYVIGDKYIWHVRNNGADGDNWSANNVKTGGAGAIGHRVPYSDKLAKEIRKTRDVATKELPTPSNRIAKPDEPLETKVARHYLEPVTKDKPPPAEGVGRAKGRDKPMPKKAPVQPTKYDETKLLYGKHAGRSLKWIAEVDPGYLRWAGENFNNAALRKKVQVVYDRHVMRKGRHIILRLKESNGSHATV